MSNGTPSFEITPGIADGSPLLTLRGSADTLVLPALTAAVGTAHLRAVELHAKRAVVDLRLLEFMNSSCFKAFVSWLSEIRELPPEQRYVVEILSDPTRHWQRRSLAALSAFGGNLVKVQNGPAQG